MAQSREHFPCFLRTWVPLWASVAAAHNCHRFSFRAHSSLASTVTQMPLHTHTQLNHFEKKNCFFSKPSKMCSQLLNFISMLILLNPCCRVNNSPPVYLKFIRAGFWVYLSSAQFGDNHINKWCLLLIASTKTSCYYGVALDMIE